MCEWVLLICFYPGVILAWERGKVYRSTTSRLSDLLLLSVNRPLHFQAVLPLALSSQPIFIGSPVSPLLHPHTSIHIHDKKCSLFPSPSSPSSLSTSPPPSPIIVTTTKRAAIPQSPVPDPYPPIPRARLPTPSPIPRFPSALPARASPQVCQRVHRLR